MYYNDYDILVPTVTDMIESTKQPIGYEKQQDLLTQAINAYDDSLVYSNINCKRVLEMMI